MEVLTLTISLRLQSIETNKLFKDANTERIQSCKNYGRYWNIEELYFNVTFLKIFLIQKASTHGLAACN